MGGTTAAWRPRREFFAPSTSDARRWRRPCPSPSDSALASLVLTFLIGVPLGLLQAIRRGRPLDHVLTVATTVAYAAPSFWLALALVAVFTYGAAAWGLPSWMRLPAFGLRSPGVDLHGMAALSDIVRHALLPVAILTAVGAAGIARYARSSIADVITQDFVRTAYAKGAPPHRVYLRHVLANVLPSLVVLFALSLPGLVAGSIFVEAIFAWPGMGRLMVNAIVARDYPLVMGAAAVYAALVLLANLAGRPGSAAGRSAEIRMNRARHFGLVELSAGTLLILLVAGAIFVPLVSRQDPLSIGQVLALRLLPPGSRDALGALHLLGTDRFGRDLFVRMMLAGRISLAVGVAGSLLASSVGTIVGASAAWIGGVFDAVCMAVADALLALPRLVLLLVCAALWRPGLATVVVVLIATGWMSVARMVRAELLGIRGRPFIDAATAIGASSSRVLWRHALPNALGPAIVATTLGVGNAILLESGLSFLGLGIQPPQPSWGNMIAGGRDLIVTAPWVAIAPGFALIITVLACTLLGDTLRDRLAGEAGTTLRDRG